MDFFAAELEAMASGTAFENAPINDKDITRWMRLFSYTAEQARDAIEAQRAGLCSITDAQWGSVPASVKEQGHDHETYAHYLRTARRASTQKPAKSQVDRYTYLLFLEGPVNTAYEVQKYACLSRVPPVKMARNNDDSIPKQVVTLRSYELDTLKQNLARKVSWNKKMSSGLQKELKVIRLSIAEKDLSPICIAPALGIDATIPHLRPNTNAPIHPAQGEYPVWYFFYGTLAEPARLVAHLDLSEDPELEPASVGRGKLKMWGKYHALMDAGPDDVVSGHAYEVRCEEHEQRLRAYETSKYEVVRCKIRFEEDDTERWGLTFRFCDDFLSECL